MSERSFERSMVFAVDRPRTSVQERYLGMDKQIICSTLAVVAVAVSSPAHASRFLTIMKEDCVRSIQFEMVRLGGFEIVPVAGMRRLISRHRPGANDNFDGNWGQTRAGQLRRLMLVPAMPAQ